VPPWQASKYIDFEKICIKVLLFGVFRGVAKGRLAAREVVSRVRREKDEALTR
jgi:hypothetical protein